jgi:hypothetical protein
VVEAEAEAFTAGVVEAEGSTVAGVGASTAALAAEEVSIAGVGAHIVEGAPSERRGPSAGGATVAAALVADSRRAATERAGVRTADSVHRAA